MSEHTGLSRRHFLLVAGAGLLYGCATAPITGRRQILLVSAEEEAAAGAEIYRQMLAKEPVTTDPRIVAPAQRVTQRLQAVTDPPVPAVEVSVIDDAETVNAFALPGGKVGIYRGMYPIAQTEAGLAIIVGHELGHVIARHGGERVSQRLLAELGGTALSVAVGTSPQAPLIMAAFGLGAEVGVLLPYSRLQESEADRIGLVLAAQAGYDPGTALGVWRRMADLSGARPPRFLSTHPLPEDRLRDIERLLPEIMPELRPHADPGHTPLPA